MGRADQPRDTSVRADSSYLVTGGLGGLGLEVAHWLCEREAGHVVLMDRGAPTISVRQRIEAVAGRDDRVSFVQGDVGRAEDVVQVLASIDGTSLPLRGVVHAAGMLEDGVLLQQSWQSFERVMATIENAPSTRRRCMATKPRPAPR